MKGHLWEYTLLSVVIIYGMVYFSYGAFQLFSFGTGDVYVHTQWIYALTQGKVFSNGVYPEGMHCFAYGVHALFGVRLYSCMLFLGCIHAATFFLGAYVFLRTIFKWKYTPMFALTVFLTFEMRNLDMLAVFARLQWSIPQEFAYHAVFLCAAYLIKFLEEKKDGGLKRRKVSVLKKSKIKKRPFSWLLGDDNLYIFIKFKHL